MLRFRSTLVRGLLLVLVVTVSCSQPETIPSRPNILLIYTDQQRFDTIGRLGNNLIQTPHLDRLVDEGVAFTHAVVPTPVCSPSRWSLMTGQWSTTHQRYSNHHEPPRPATDLVKELRGAGYRTGLSGKNHTFLEAEDFDFWEEKPEPLDPVASRERRRWMESVGKKYPRLAEEAVPGGIEADPAHAKTDAALRFIEADDGRPFFLWLSYNHPHSPYMVPEPFFSMYKNVTLPEPAIEAQGLEAAGKPFRQQYHQKNNDAVVPFTSEQVRLMRQVYYGQIFLLDRKIGRVLDYLEQKGLAENTLVVFTSDHGDYMGDHGLMAKSPAMYDCLVRVPFLVRWPGHIDGGRRDTRFVSHVDLMPTFLEVAGQPIPNSVQGASLVPLLRDGGQGESVRSAAYSEYGVPGAPYDESRLAQEGLADKPYVNPSDDRLPWEANPVALSGRFRMIRTHQWKYVEEVGGTCELYDLENDPDELVNLCRRNEHREVRDRLAGRLNEWKRGLPGIELDEQ